MGPTGSHGPPTQKLRYALFSHHLSVTENNCGGWERKEGGKEERKEPRKDGRVGGLSRCPAYYGEG